MRFPDHLELLSTPLLASICFNDMKQISEHVERLVTLLKGDEKPLEEVRGDGWSHELSDVDGDQKDTQNSTIRPETATPASLGDDDDDKIVEV